MAFSKLYVYVAFHQVERGKLADSLHVKIAFWFYGSAMQELVYWYQLTKLRW